jgi:hypothetical protein
VEAERSRGLRLTQIERDERQSRTACPLEGAEVQRIERPCAGLLGDGGCELARGTVELDDGQRLEVAVERAPRTSTIVWRAVTRSSSAVRNSSACRESGSDTYLLIGALESTKTVTRPCPPRARRAHAVAM